MKLVIVTEYRPRGGGYSAIAEGLVNGLVALKQEVKVIGINWDMSESPLPCSLIPSSAEWVGEHLRMVARDWIPDAVVVMLDIPHQQTIVPYVKSLGGFKYIAVSPVEGAPVCREWADALNAADGRLVLSEFGIDQLAEVGVEARLLPVSYTPGLLRATPENIAKMREYAKLVGRFVVLKIADNTTRKNWADTIRFFAKYHLPGDVLFAVTRPENANGYDIFDLIEQTGAVKVPQTAVWVWNDGAECRVLAHVRRNDIAWLLNVSDGLIMDTGNEGLGMPILEAFQTRLPVMGMRHTAMRELLADGRGIYIEPGAMYIDAFGNVERYHNDETAWHKSFLELRIIAQNTYLRESMTRRAAEWLAARTWTDAALAVLKEVLR